MKKRTIKRIATGALAMTCAVAVGIYFNESKNASAGESNTRNCYMGVGVYDFSGCATAQCVYFADINMDTMEKSTIKSSTLVAGKDGEFCQSVKQAVGYEDMLESYACYTDADYIGDNKGKYKAAGKGVKSCVVASDTVSSNNCSYVTFTGNWSYNGKLLITDTHTLYAKGESYYVSHYK